MPEKKIKHSIKTKMIVLFSVVLLAALVACWLMNIVFLERYYIQNKQKVLIEVFQMLDEASRQSEMETDEFLQRLNAVCERNNISPFVMDVSGQVRICTKRDFELNQMSHRLYRYLFGQFSLGDRSKILLEQPYYMVCINMDSYTNAEYMEMVGSLAEQELFLIRTPLEPIRESVLLANRFLAYVGLSVLLIGALIIQILAKQIARPLLELARLSERMSNLDFTVKFSGKVDDEITFLGNHMNQLSEALEHTISELKTANNELKRDIEQREKIDEMRKEFLSNVSHELKTPIALVQGYAEGLQECINDDAESRSFYCEVIIDEASKMNQMVKNLLALNELEFGNEVVTMEHFDLTAMIHNILQSAQILFEQKQVRLVFEEQEAIYVWANEYKLQEVFNNYISNALNHVDGEKIIKVTIQRQKEQVRVGVFNTGKPIPEQDIEKIWDKFYKVDKARTREYGGSGVGLSIVKAIMESMHQEYGVINYTNGVEFWFHVDCSKVDCGR